jgi:hypothetical protein
MDITVMRFGNNESVALARRKDIEEGKMSIVFIDLMCRNIAGDY